MGVLGVVGVIMLGFAVAGGGVWAVMSSFGFPDGSRYIWHQFMNTRGVWSRVVWCWLRRCGGCPGSRCLVVADRRVRAEKVGRG